MNKDSCPFYPSTCINCMSRDCEEVVKEKEKNMLKRFLKFIGKKFMSLSLARKAIVIYLIVTNVLNSYTMFNNPSNFQAFALCLFTSLTSFMFGFLWEYLR